MSCVPKLLRYRPTIDTFVSCVDWGMGVQGRSCRAKKRHLKRPRDGRTEEGGGLLRAHVAGDMAGETVHHRLCLVGFRFVRVARLVLSGGCGCVGWRGERIENDPLGARVWTTCLYSGVDKNDGSVVGNTCYYVELVVYLGGARLDRGTGAIDVSHPGGARPFPCTRARLTSSVVCRAECSDV